jgi:ParB-like chromosome segregation protein Spo0J
MTRDTHRRVPIALIDVPSDRLSRPKPARIETIGKTAKAVGLIQAISVEATEAGRFTLIAGGKRLAALTQNGETEIDARVARRGRPAADRDHREP